MSKHMNPGELQEGYMLDQAKRIDEALTLPADEREKYLVMLSAQYCSLRMLSALALSACSHQPLLSIYRRR